MTESILSYSLRIIFIAAIVLPPGFVQTEASKVEESRKMAEKIVVNEVFERLREHEFHPVDKRSFTVDRTLQTHGISDMYDPDWRVRVLAIRDLVRVGEPAIPHIVDGLEDEDVQVRYASATALGILRATDAVDALKRTARKDEDPLVRSPAVVALGHIEADEALGLLLELSEDDSSVDVRHQAKLSADQIEKRMGATPELAAAWRALDQEDFGRVYPGDPPPDFALPDTEGNTWRLSEKQNDQWTLLIWVFADWCPVCHGEFQELMEFRDRIEALDVTVATIECHDLYRSRVMVGQELDPEYRFADESFHEQYRESIWWPHLMDRAGLVGVQYGIDPMAYSVHAEYINRPATVIIDPDGIVRLAYFGTYWGDRPSIEEALDMIEHESFEYTHPQRLSAD